MATAYYKFNYDNEASGPFTELSAFPLTWAGGTGFVITVRDDGTTGEIYMALVSGTPPADNDTVTQGGTTADVNEPIAPAGAKLLEYPAYMRRDNSIASNGDVRWTGPALGVSHSFEFDGQTVNVSVGEILTFSPGGQECEVITVVSDLGASGELDVRWITPLDTLGLPSDNDTFTGDGGGNGALDGVVHDRGYLAFHMHRWLSDLHDDESPSGDDDLSRTDPQPSSKDTPTQVNLLGTVNIDDTVAQHMYGGSINQADGDTLYAGLNVKVTSPKADTRPIVIRNFGIITDYWSNGYFPDSIQGNVRIMVKVRDDGADIDGRRVEGRLLEYGEGYFIAGTTLGTGETQLSLVSAGDGNNNTIEATVAGAPYNSIVITDGLQQLDFLNGNGATPFALSFTYGAATSPQAYERWKWIQRSTSAETLFGADARLVTGVNLNFAYDGELGGPFVENEVVAWGDEIAYTGQTVNLQVDEVVTFSGGGRGRILAIRDAGATGDLIVKLEPGPVPGNTETITGVTSGGDGTVSGAATTNATAGTAILCALDDQGANGNLYLNLRTGLAPSDNQLIRGGTSAATCLVDGAPQSRVINNQFIGIYTGTNFQTNFGLAVDPGNAVLGDLFPNLLGVNQGPPDNRQGTVNAAAGDTIIIFAWDGVATDVNGAPEPDFNEMTLATALIAATSTQVDVGAGNIPNNTPQNGNLRVERDSDGNYDLIPYDSHDGDRYFEIVGTAPSAAAISNNAYRSPVDKVSITGTETFSAVYSDPPSDFGITVLRGSNNPIKPFNGSASFGPFNVNATRIDDG